MHTYSTFDTVVKIVNEEPLVLMHTTLTFNDESAPTWPVELAFDVT